jgi:hypothetical protein
MFLEVRTALEVAVRPGTSGSIQMTRSPIRASALALTLAWLACAAPLSAQQTYTLKARSRPGDKWAFDVSSVIKQKGQITANGQPQPIDQSADQHRRGTMEILAAANDVPTAIRVTFDADSANGGSFAGQPAPKFAMAGKTVTLRREPEGAISNDLVQPPDEQTLGELNRLLEPDITVYPAHPIAVGETWDADNAALAKQFLLGPDDKVSMKCKLTGVEDLDGRQVADVGVSGQVLKHDQGFILTTTDLQGVSRIDMTTGQILQADLTGKMSSRGQHPADPTTGQPAVSVDADGQLEMHQRIKPLGESAPAIATDAPVSARTIASTPASAPAPGPENPLARRTISMAGSYKGDELSLDLSGDPAHYTGTLTLRDKSFPLTARGQGNKVTGTFQAAGASFEFTAALDIDTLTVISDGNTYILRRSATIVRDFMSVTIARI